MVFKGRLKANSAFENLGKFKVVPDLYIITPFVVVAEQLRSLVRESGILEGWIEEDAQRWTSQRIGTVHTAQAVRHKR